MDDMWLRRLSEFIVPTPDELAVLEEAKSDRREFKRNEVISSEGSPVQEVYFLVDGWVEGSVGGDFGRKQLTKIYLPGDFAGMPNVAMSRTAEHLVALNQVTVDAIPIDRLPLLFEKAPRFGCMLFVTAQQERVMLMDHLATVGQLRAIQRVASLLVEVHGRLSALRPEIGNVIDWPLSQERVAQSTGLTSVHINRSFGELARRGLIAREGRRMTLLDLEQLAELAGLPERHFAQQPSWLATCCLPREHRRGRHADKAL